MIYLDSASTTRTDPRVIDKIYPYLTELYGNAGTMYDFGKQSAKAIEEARENVANLIGARPEQIIFTSGGTEANNMVFQSTKEYLMFKHKTHVVTTQIEHDSILNSVRNLCQIQYSTDGVMPQKFTASYVPPIKNGGVSSNTVIDYINSSNNVGLVSVIHTNNETGIINKGLSDIGKVCNKTGILFHTDCVQAASCEKLDVNELMCDFMSLSSHKIHGVKGVGALYIRNKSVVSPMICGGNSQEFGLRGGTENVVGIVGFGMACKLLKLNQEEEIEYVTKLRNDLYNGICDALGEFGLATIVHVNGNLDFDMPGKTLNIRFDGIDGETLLMMLDSEGVCATSGSACRSHEVEPSYVLKSMGLSNEQAMSSIRLSVSRMNTKEEIDKACKIIAECVNFLKH